MKKSYYIAGIIFLSLSIIAAFSVPIIQIVKYQDILENGVAIKVKLAAFDPYDAFRGRFVALDLDFGEYRLTKATPRDQIFPNNFHGVGLPVDIVLGKDKNGFAYIKDLSFDLNKTYDEDAIIIRGLQRYWQVTQEKENWHSIIALRPETHIKRFYMNEKLAPEAEKALQNNKIREKSYAVIKIKNKIPVIENIYIGDESLSDYLD